jgi:hypothetical protein
MSRRVTGALRRPWHARWAAFYHVIANLSQKGVDRVVLRIAL